MIEEKNRSLAAMQATHEVRTTELGMELEKERDKFATLQKRLQGILVLMEDPSLIM